ncbi:TetR/AcrR family transcriptional regulator [Sutcliffiella sp. NPDC057660]|uniref:TetR/AcrR family transcriptional regulator n=1 Tax=Sutcliffiella sp. NPDC057660 TaxID=3346199 RepID=UPI0036CAECC5
MEKKMNKRKQLIDAAYKVFVKKGYLNASIKDIANEAMMTPGLVHYYFKNKEELLLSVQEEVQTNYHRQYDGQTQEMPSLKSTLNEIKSRAHENPDWYRWRYEIYSLGIKDAEGNLEQQVRTVLKNGRDSISRPMESILGDTKEASSLASVLLACFDGLALQRIVDPEFDIDQSYEVLHKMLELYLNKEKG